MDQRRLAAERLHQAQQRPDSRSGSYRPIETRKGDTIQADHGPNGTARCYFA
jgi:hypothetical protein